MRSLKKRAFMMICLSCFCLLIIVLFFLTGKYGVAIWVTSPRLFAVLGFCLGTVGSLLEIRKLINADLIVENQIMFIQSAKTARISEEKSLSEECRSIDVFISCFGILLDTRVIRFNPNRIRLISIVLSNDFIAFSYEKNKRVFQVRVLHKWMEAKELGEIADKFRYETGIVPKIQEKWGCSVNPDMHEYINREKLRRN